MSFWQSYNAKVKQKILNPRCAGVLTDPKKDEMRLVIGEEGSYEDGNFAKLYLLIDTQDGVIADARFQLFGETPLIATIETLCILVIRKNLIQAQRITADLLEKQGLTFNEKGTSYLNFAISLLDACLQKCLDIQVDGKTIETPFALGDLECGELPDWDSFSQGAKVRYIEEVLEREIQPYVALDEGRVKFKLLEGLQVTVEYEGACTTCYSAAGSTLTAIQQILKARVHPEITVLV